MIMPCSNTAALRIHEEEQDRLEREPPSDAEVKAKQEEMYWNRLHDLDALCDALSPGEWGDLQENLMILIGEELAHARATEDGEEKQERWGEAGRLLASLMGTRLYPSPDDAEYALRNPE